MKSQNQHPDFDQLRAFGLGRLDPETMEQVAEHVATCDDCCRQLNDLGDDTLLGRLKQADTPFSTDDTLGGLSVRPVDRPRVRVPAALREHPKYRILEHIGQGGMGDVFKAEHQVMGRVVALKVIRPELVKHERAVRRFHQEVRAAAGLDHRNIVTAHDAEQAEDLHFLVMEFVEGRSLDKVVATHGALPVRHACHYARQVALGLEHAHQRGLVHRDIKPHNLMLTTRGVVKILDFGLARLGVLTGDRPDGALTTAGTTLGTPDYVAPEQIRDSRSVDHRADLYGLGCTLYFLLTGQVPFPTTSYVSTLQSHLSQQPPPLDQVRRDLPAGVVQLVRRLMAKRPQDRPQTARQVADLLAPYCRAGGEKELRSDVPAQSGAPVRSGDPVPDGGPLAGTPDPLRGGGPLAAMPPAVATGGLLGADRLLGADDETLVALEPAGSFSAASAVVGQRVAGEPGGLSPRRPTSRRRSGSSGRGWSAAMLPVSLVAGLLALTLAGWMVWGWSRGDGSQGGSSQGGTANRSAENPDLPSPAEAFSTAAAAAGADSQAAGDGKPILIVVPDRQVWYRDLQYFQQGLRDVPCPVRLASATISPVSSLNDEQPGPNVQPDLLLNDVRVGDYRAIVFVGYSVENYFPEGEHGATVGRILAEALADPACRVAGICAGNAVLARHGVLRGRRAAASRWAVQLGARDQDADWREDPIVVDDRILTAGEDRSAEGLARLLAGDSSGEH